MQKFLIHGLLAGVLSSATGIIFVKVYEEMMFVDFNAILNPISIAAACIFSCIIMGLIGFAISKSKRKYLQGWFNISTILVTGLSLLGPLAFSLPLDIEFPEMFPGMAMPLHFLPALYFFGIAPFFNK